jgi:hypothetical protein
VPSNLTRFLEFEVGDGQIMRTTGFLAKEGDLFRRICDLIRIELRVKRPIVLWVSRIVAVRGEVDDFRVGDAEFPVLDYRGDTAAVD